MGANDNYENFNDYLKINIQSALKKSGENQPVIVERNKRFTIRLWGGVFCYRSSECRERKGEK